MIVSVDCSRGIRLRIYGYDYTRDAKTKLVYSSKGSVAKQTQLKGESDRVQVYIYLRPPLGLFNKSVHPFGETNVLAINTLKAKNKKK